MHPPQVSPIPQRLHYLDALRGLALLGIFLSIINGFNFSPVFFESFNKTHPDLWSRIWGSMNELIISQRFIAIFSLLFGVGISIQRANFLSKNAHFAVFYIRRMLLLALLGLINTTFFFWGEILLTYAIFGLLLAPFFKANFRVLVTSSILIYVLVHPIWVMHFGEGVAEYLMAPLLDSYQAEDLFRIYRDGSFREMMVLRWHEYVALFSGNDEYLRTSFCLILLGYGLGKYNYLHRFIHTIDDHHKWLVLSGVIAGILSLFTLSTGLYSLSLRISPPVAIALSIWRLASTYFYIHLFLLLYHRTRLRRVLDVFGYVGRMSLSNYMLGAFLYALIFHNMGLGLYAKLPMWTEFPIALGVYMICLTFSWRWQTLYLIGPLEWVWRSFSYWKKQPMLKEPTFYTQR
jgi:uncharacterized protein